MASIPLSISTLKMDSSVKEGVESLFRSDVQGNDPGEKKCRVVSCRTENEVSQAAAQVLQKAAALTGPTDELSPQEWKLVRDLLAGGRTNWAQSARMARWFFHTESEYAWSQFARVDQAIHDPIQGRALLIKQVILDANRSDDLAPLDLLPQGEIKAVVAQLLAGNFDDEITERVTSNFFQEVGDTPPAVAHEEARRMALTTLARTGADDPLLLATAEGKSVDVIETARGRLVRLLNQTVDAGESDWPLYEPRIVQALMLRFVLDDPQRLQTFKTDPGATSNLVVEDTCRSIVALFRGEIQRSTDIPYSLADQMMRMVNEELGTASQRPSPSQPPAMPRRKNSPWNDSNEGIPG